MIKFSKFKNKKKIEKYFKEIKLDKLLNSEKNDKKTFPPNLLDLYRIHRFVIKNKRICALEYGTGWSSIIIQHALNINKLRFKLPKGLRFKNPFSLTILDDDKKYLNISRKRFLNFFGKNIRTKFSYSKTRMVEYKKKYGTEYTNHPVLNPDFIYLDGPSQHLVRGKINNFTTNHQDLMPMSIDILKYEHFLTPGTIILIDGRTANARFLKLNLQRNWLYKHDVKNDQSIFYLQEKPLGQFNKLQLNFYNNKKI